MSKSNPQDHTTILLDDPEAKPMKDFPHPELSVDDILSDYKIRKLKKKQRSRIRTSESEPAGGIYHGTSRRSSTVAFHILQQGVKNMKEFKLAMKDLNPTKLPFIDRVIKDLKARWPGQPSLKKILYSPYFFVYIVSMSLIQAFIAGVAPPDFTLPNGMLLTAVISLIFFILYLLEVLLRIMMRGFEFFLSVYNLAEVSITLSAFILDYLVQGTSFVAMVLSLRIIWCIHKVPGMQFIVEGIKIAAPRISVILFPLFIVIYIFGVLCTNLLGPASFDYPSKDYWQPFYNYTFSNGTVITIDGANLPYDYYGNVARSMYTLFQVMTGDAWCDQIGRPTIKYRPWSWVMFVVFYILTAFVLLNIFTGIMVDAIQSYETEKSLKKQMEIDEKEKKSTYQIDNDDKSEKSSIRKIKSLSTISEDEKDEISPPGSPPLVPLENTPELSSRERLSNLDHVDKNMKGAHSIPTALIIREIQNFRDEARKINSKLMQKITLMEMRLNKLESP